jgi:transcriptional antiterminator NusG
MAKNWYVIHTLTGQEEKVKATIDFKIKEAGMENLISQVVVPKQKVAEIKSGKKRITERKFFPGYVLIEMELNDDTWYLIRTISGVSKFISSGAKPVALNDAEVAAIKKQMEDSLEKPAPKVVFEKGESVRINEGPFLNFTGIVEEINPEKGKLKVMVTIFGRATPVELEFWQVEKI